ncbi:subtilisin-like protein [Daldinia loculata]|uniref:subtilisin-like protein n=1 Tax=Daldinia loculata TaxID=103429 RepID=UPI0020C1D3F1|nr:subtilisin-like protein [Daldinia loculata]KAI1651916.1 subtilisin-like protein [Daldinia loculata]
MKTFHLLLAALVPLALAKAPLMHRDIADGIDDNYIVVMKSATPKTFQAHYQRIHYTSSQRSKGAKKGVVKTYQVPGFNGYHVECDDATLDNIRNDPLVSYVARDGRVTAQAAISRNAPRSDPQADTWGLGRISHRDPGVATYVDDVASNTESPTYAYILDTGIRVTHQEFGGRATFGKNFINGAQDVDDNGHGTHTAATVGGNTVGVNNSTMLIGVKVLDKDSSGSWSGIIAGIDWAVNDAQTKGKIDRSVINMSIGGPRFQALDDVVKNAVATGMTLVVAASNYGVDACTYSPAAVPEAITVAAIDQNDNRPDWSNWGSCVDIFAPGSDIYSAWIDSDSDYVSMSGTSMACPHVAGLVTYLMSRESISGAQKVTSRLIDLGTRDKVQNANGSPNLIAFNGNEAEL